MTEKIKLTQEQVDALNTFKLRVGRNLEYFMRNSSGWTNDFAPLKSFSVDDFARLLYEPDSYEIAPNYKIGDWVVRTKTNEAYRDEMNYNTGEIFIITGIEKDRISDNNNKFHYFENIRIATPEEIKVEKERLLWTGLGRQVGEFKYGDVVINHHDITYRIKNNGYLRLEEAKTWHDEGRIKSFYPIESLVTFGDGEINGI